MTPSATEEVEIEHLRRLRNAQSRLVTAVQDLSLARTVPAVQQIVQHAAREIAAADGASFVLREGDRCYYANEDAIAPLWKGQKFPMSACVSGWSMLNAKPAVIPDVFDDPRVPADVYRPTFVKSLVMVPIRLTAPIGAIGVYWSHPRAATAEEVELLQALANTTAVALENVQVYAELEHRVAQRTQQLEALNHELEAFSYSVSHDLRAPLRSISGFASLLAEELGDKVSDDARYFLKTVQLSATRMNQLIDDLLQLSRLSRQEVRRTDVDLAELAHAIVYRLRSDSPGRNVEVSLPRHLVVSGDLGLLSIALENLLSNAWKYTSKTEQARIELGEEEPQNGARVVYVRDNGAGFNPKHADKLFSPFQRLHSPEEFPGNGIGLATVQRIVHRHGGRIWAAAEEGKGATFYFTCDGEAANTGA